MFIAITQRSPVRPLFGRSGGTPGYALFESRTRCHSSRRKTSSSMDFKTQGQAIVIKYFFFACLLKFFSNGSTLFLRDSSLRSLVSNSMIAWLILIGLLRKCSAMSFTLYYDCLSPHRAAGDFR